MSYYPGQPRKAASPANSGRRQNDFPSFSDSMFDPFSFGDSTRDMIEQQHPYYKQQQEQLQRRQMAEQQQCENELRRQQLQRNQREAALRRHQLNQQQQEAAYRKQQESYQKEHEAALRRQQHQQQLHQQHHQSQRSKKQQEQLQHQPKAPSEKSPLEHFPQQARSDQRQSPHLLPDQHQVGRPVPSNKSAKRRARRRQSKSHDQGAHQDPVEDIAGHSFFQSDQQKDDLESLVEAAFGDSSPHTNKGGNTSRPRPQERPVPNRQPQRHQHRQHRPQEWEVREKEQEQEEQEQEEKEDEDEGENVEEEEEQVSTPETSSMETSDHDDQENEQDDEEEEEQEQPHPQSEKRHAELQAIEKNLDELEVELEQILAGQIKKKKQILMTEEMLTKAMLKVDSIESEGDWSIRKRRKALINKCESLLERVDGYKRQHREELRL